MKESHEALHASTPVVENRLEVPRLESPGVAPPSPAVARIEPLESFSYPVRWFSNAVFLSLGYASAIALALALAGGIRWVTLGAPMVPAQAWLAAVLWPLAAFGCRLIPGWGLGAVEEMRRSVLLAFGLFGGAAVLLFISKTGSDFSRLTLALSFAIGLPAVLTARILVKRLLIHLGIWGLPTVIYGGGKTGQLVAETLRMERGLGFSPVGFLDIRPDAPAPRATGLPYLGSSGDVRREAAVAIVAMPGVPSARIAELLEGPLAGYRKVIIVPDLFDAPSLWVKPRDFLGVLGLEISNNLSSRPSRFVKRAADLVLTLLSAPLWMPLAGLIALCIWLGDRGSPLFVQERVGQGGRVFRMFKFRTMLVDAEAVLKRALDEDAALRLEWETNFKLARDPRITKLGQFLRRTSLDEIPQLFNVLRGEISLVGPRPLPAYHREELSDRAGNLREQVRPGITGLWQVSGRSDLGTPGMERWDPYYVRNWSIWLDMVILVRTVRAVIHGRGAV